MASQNTEKHYYIEHQKLRDKYQGYFDRVKSTTKAIADASRTKITVDLKKNKTIQFIITGGKRGVDKALNNVQNEFEKAGYAKQPSRPKSLFLGEDDHKKLQQEASASKDKNVCLLTEAALRKFDILTGAIELRQFACRPCDRFWWANVLRTKPVSPCNNCQVVYNALDRNKEFGIGRFMCSECDHSFYARCEATEFHVCYKCEKLTGPPYINPRFKGHKSYFSPRHRPPPPELLKVINASTPHESTGSTIASFLTDDLGSDIYVRVVRPQHAMTVKDFRNPPPEEESAASFFTTEGAGVCLMTPGSVKDPELMEKFLQSGRSVEQLTLTSVEMQSAQYVEQCIVSPDIELQSGLHVEHPAVSSDVESDTENIVSRRKRTAGSDSSDSDSPQSDDDSDSSSSPSDDDSTRPNVPSSESDGEDDDRSKSDKMSTSGQHSEPDSGIGTMSHPGTSSEFGTASSSTKPFMNSSLYDFKTDYPGVVFSKEKAVKRITSEGGSINGEGIKLFVPEGAVRSEDSVTISLQACIGGPFSLPEDLSFVSPVYLIEPPFAFHKYLRLTIDLFVELADVEDYEDIVFVTSPTKYVNDESGEIHWKFRTYGSPEFLVGGSGCGKGFLDLKHFCFGAFARHIGAKKKKCLYFAALYQPSFFYPPQSTAIFSVTLHHIVHIKNLERYLKKEYESVEFTTTTKSVSFTDEKYISFALPTEDVSRQGYNLISNMTPCKILKEEVDIPLRKSTIKDTTLYPPRFVLKISSRDETVTSVLNFSLKLEGIKEDVTFNISLLPSKSNVVSGSSQQQDSPSLSTSASSSMSSASAGVLNEPSSPLLTQSSSGHSSQGSQEGLDVEPSLGSLLNYLTAWAHEWETIAILLGLEDEMMSIETDGKDVKDKLRRVLRTWKQQRKEPYSWRTIVNVLEQDAMGANEVANRIRAEVSR